VAEERNESSEELGYNAQTGDYHLRQRGIVPMDNLEGTPARIIGVGGIGRPLALLLATTGVKTMILYDDDSVQPSNVGSQGYAPSDVGLYKVLSMAADIECCTPVAESPITYRHRFPLESTVDIDLQDPLTIGAVFCCVDRIEVRTEIFDWLCLEANDTWDVFIDGRMGGEAGRILTIPNEAVFKELYRKTLFPADEQEMLPCTERATAYCGSFIASIMVAQYVKVLRRMSGLDVFWDPDLLFSLLSNELFTPHAPQGDSENTVSSDNIDPEDPDIGDLYMEAPEGGDIDETEPTIAQ
jgi:hypothetical protein